MASSVFSHLGAAGRTQAQLDDKARIELIERDRWIDYLRALQAMSRLEQLMETPQRERMPYMVIHGESNIGKTLIIRKFQRDHPGSSQETEKIVR